MTKKINRKFLTLLCSSIFLASSITVATSGTIKDPFIKRDFIQYLDTKHRNVTGKKGYYYIKSYKEYYWKYTALYEEVSSFDDETFTEDLSSHYTTIYQRIEGGLIWNKDYLLKNSFNWDLDFLKYFSTVKEQWDAFTNDKKQKINNQRFIANAALKTYESEINDFKTNLLLSNKTYKQTLLNYIDEINKIDDTFYTSTSVNDFNRDIVDLLNKINKTDLIYVYEYNVLNNQIHAVKNKLETYKKTIENIFLDVFPYQKIYFDETSFDQFQVVIKGLKDKYTSLVKPSKTDTITLTAEILQTTQELEKHSYKILMSNYIKAYDKNTLLGVIDLINFNLEEKGVHPDNYNQNLSEINAIYNVNNSSASCDKNTYNERKELIDTWVLNNLVFYKDKILANIKIFKESPELLEYTVLETKTTVLNELNNYQYIVETKTTDTFRNSDYADYETKINEWKQKILTVTNHDYLINLIKNTKDKVYANVSPDRINSFIVKLDKINEDILKHNLKINHDLCKKYKTQIKEFDDLILSNKEKIYQLISEWSLKSKYYTIQSWVDFRELITNIKNQINPDSFVVSDELFEQYKTQITTALNSLVSNKSKLDEIIEQKLSIQSTKYTPNSYDNYLVKIKELKISLIGSTNITTDQLSAIEIQIAKYEKLLVEYKKQLLILIDNKKKADISLYPDFSQEEYLKKLDSLLTNINNEAEIDLIKFNEYDTLINNAKELLKTYKEFLLIDVLELEAIEKKYYSEDSFNLFSNDFKNQKNLIAFDSSIDLTKYLTYKNNLSKSKELLVSYKTLLNKEIEKVERLDKNNYWDDSYNKLINYINELKIEYNSIENIEFIKYNELKIKIHDLMDNLQDLKIGLKIYINTRKNDGQLIYFTEQSKAQYLQNLDVQLSSINNSPINFDRGQYNKYKEYIDNLSTSLQSNKEWLIKQIAIATNNVEEFQVSILPEKYKKFLTDVKALKKEVEDQLQISIKQAKIYDDNLNILVSLVCDLKNSLLSKIDFYLNEKDYQIYLGSSVSLFKDKIKLKKTFIQNKDKISFIEHNKIIEEIDILEISSLKTLKTDLLMKIENLNKNKNFLEYTPQSESQYHKAIDTQLEILNNPNSLVNLDVYTSMKNELENSIEKMLIKNIDDYALQLEKQMDLSKDDYTSESWEKFNTELKKKNDEYSFFTSLDQINYLRLSNELNGLSKLLITYKEVLEKELINNQKEYSSNKGKYRSSACKKYDKYFEKLKHEVNNKIIINKNDYNSYKEKLSSTSNLLNNYYVNNKMSFMEYLVWILLIATTAGIGVLVFFIKKSIKKRKNVIYPNNQDASLNLDLSNQLPNETYPNYLEALPEPELNNYTNVQLEPLETHNTNIKPNSNKPKRHKK
ncbi:hypothetical protein [Mycoplasma crocodyli]|uniref:Uncharacterized protein n=1 Tax=Mycoplasma crocodyli (strain ATCC 51981 / MP145) TaxID=512564 RepID=D5E591_MYCCM|nr:hypothetical protein [Mycoplasma crocodyli]ADE19404.1 hypothetical protein MCRO_0282 [Mycoplasma crocodyli MP145]